MYTGIELKWAFVLFWLGFLLYGIVLCCIKICLNENFKADSIGEKLQHIIEAMNIPDAYGDWDTDNSLSIAGHKKMWRKILLEMMVMVGLQFLTNMMLLIPFFVAGIIFLSIKHSLCIIDTYDMLLKSKDKKTTGLQSQQKPNAFL